LSGYFFACQHKNPAFHFHKNPVSLFVCQAALEIIGDHRAARASRCILLGLTGNYYLAVEDAAVLQGGSSAFIVETCMRAREVALGGSGGGGSMASPLAGPRAAIRLVKAIIMIEKGTMQMPLFFNLDLNLEHSLICPSCMCACVSK
jgi:hypothetical protein